MSRHKQPVSPAKGYETRDANLRAVVLTGIGLGGLVIVSLFVVSWTLNAVSGRKPEPEPVPPVLLDGRRPMSGPLLQEAPYRELAQFRRTEEARLSGYGHDPQTQTIHIPIEKAMELVLARGLPARDVGTESSAAATRPAR